MTQKVDIPECKKVIPSNPCDPPSARDPHKEPGGACPESYVCLEKVNTEKTCRCQSGSVTAPKVDVQENKKVIPAYPCDPTPPCDPHKEPGGARPKPFFCLEKVKNPEYKGDPENSLCQAGSFMHAKSCLKDQPQHPCKPAPSEKKICQKKPTRVPFLDYERIKNPDPKLIPPECPKNPEPTSDPIIDPDEVDCREDPIPEKPEDPLEEDCHQSDT